MRVFVTDGADEIGWYDSVKDVSVSTSTDVTASAMPESSVEMVIRTDDQIPVGSLLAVYDDVEDEYGLTYSDITRRVSYAEVEEPHSVHIKTTGAVDVLDRVTLPAVMATEMTADAVVSAIQAAVGIYMMRTADSIARLSAVTAGYLPEQSARERLLWMCLISGTYVRATYYDGVSIDVPQTTAKVIPEEDTFWRPRVAYADYVTAVAVTYYSYEERLPSRTEEYVEVGGSIYVQVSDVMSVQILGLPEGTPENVITVDGITAVSERTVDDVLSRLADMHFNRATATLDVVNDRNEYRVGDLVTAMTGIGNQTVTGHVSDMSYSYGLRTRASMTIVGARVGRSGRVEIRYWLDDTQVGQRSFRLPVNTQYDIPVPYLDSSFGGHRYILRPQVPNVTGVIVDGETVIRDVPVEIVLDYHEGDLLIAGVDAAQVVEGNLSIS